MNNDARVVCIHDENENVYYELIITIIIIIINIIIIYITLIYANLSNLLFANSDSLQKCFPGR